MRGIGESKGRGGLWRLGIRGVQVGRLRAGRRAVGFDGVGLLRWVWKDGWLVGCMEESRGGNS